MHPRPVHLVVAGVLVTGVLGCRPLTAAGPSPSSTTSWRPPATSCHEVAGRADRACTPGATNTAVTQATLDRTVCVPGYTARVRPPESYTERLKRKQIAAYGYADRRLSAYEEDHLIPLEVGGSPDDPRNLWPEPRAGAHDATTKDTEENALHRAICDGRMTLAQAQAQFITDWTHPAGAR